MTSLRQIAANKKNARKSTGPITDEGKNTSRRNSVKHGLAGSGLLLPGDDEAAIESRKAEWRNYFLIETPEQEFVFDQLIVNSIRLDRCRQEENTIRLNESQHAENSWDDDRHDEAAEIAGKLGKRPIPYSRRLQRTKQGVEWMIECWHDLADTLDGGGMWSESQTALALDLLGKPLEVRDFLEPIENPASLCAREIAHLERRKESALKGYDDFERAATQRGCPIEPSRAMRNLRRYEAACMRTYLWAMQLLQPYRQTPAPTPPPPPAPPEPEPEPQDDPELVDTPVFPTPSFTATPTFRLPESHHQNRRARRAAAKQGRRRCA